MCALSLPTAWAAQSKTGKKGKFPLHEFCSPCLCAVPSWCSLMLLRPGLADRQHGSHHQQSWHFFPSEPRCNPNAAQNSEHVTLRNQYQLQIWHLRWCLLAIIFLSDRIFILYFPLAPKYKVVLSPRFGTSSSMEVPVVWIADYLGSGNFPAPDT